MKLEKLDPDDNSAIADLIALFHAANAVDEPWQPAPVPQVVAAFSRHGWDGEPEQQWLLRDETDGPVIGRLAVHLPERDNRHRADIGVLVHPDHRRRGHGTRLFEAGLDIVRETGRGLLTAATVDAPGPNAFAEKHGFDRAIVEIQRRQDLALTDRADLADLRTKAAEAAHDYTLLRLVDAVPDDLVDRVAEMTAAINDAPRDELDLEDEVFDADRIRGFERAQADAGLTLYRVIACRKDDGAFAGHTLVAVHPEQPEHAWQYDTSVLAAHRGHRLGMLLKSDMLTWLAEVAPRAKLLDTWNAESNAHMIAVNERLGYQIVGRYLGYQRNL